MPRETTSHGIHHMTTFAAGPVACEMEWSNEAPFHYRGLESCKRLHADGVISVGGIISRGASL